MKKQKCVFLDRDGVLNHAIVRDRKPFSPRSISEFTLMPNVVKNVKKIRSLGYLTIITTNQPDISTGKLSLKTLELFHNILNSKLELTDIYFCPHLESDNCKCRKPKCGMINDAVKKYNIDLNKSFVIGDRWRDIDCGIKSGCKTIFIDYNYKEKLNKSPHASVSNLSSGVKLIEKWKFNDRSS